MPSVPEGGSSSLFALMRWLRMGCAVRVALWSSTAVQDLLVDMAVRWKRGAAKYTSSSEVSVLV